MYRSSLALACLAIAVTASADKYTLTDLGTFYPNRINDYDQMSGDIPVGTFDSQAAFWTPSSRNAAVGSVTTLPGDWVGGINDFGQVAFRSRAFVDAHNLGHALIFTPLAANGTIGNSVEVAGGQEVDITGPAINAMGQISFEALSLIIGESNNTYIWTPDSPHASTGSLSQINTFEPQAMNDFGQVIGNEDDTTIYTAKLWTPASANGPTGTLTDLGNLGGTGYSFPLDINNRGQVTGLSYTADHFWSTFRWDPASPNAATGAMVNIGSESTTYQTFGKSIDESGVAYGAYEIDPSGNYRATIFKDGHVIDLNSLVTVSNGYISDVRDTNAAGEIACVFFVNGVSHGGLLTPRATADQVVDIRHLVEHLVQIGALLPANGQSLYAKLDAATAKIKSGDLAGAVTSLQSFISQVNTFIKTGKLTTAQGQVLIDDAKAIIAQLTP